MENQAHQPARHSSGIRDEGGSEAEAEAEPTFGWIGGALCLDFANTVSDHRALRPAEKLGSFANLITWCHQADILDESASIEMLRQGTMVPAQGERLLHVAVDFRESLYRAFCDVSEGRQPSKCDLNVINGLLARTPITLQISAERERLVCFRTGCALDEARLLGPVAWSAAELLGSSESLAKVRQCAGDECGWLFLDLTKNHSRRWCDMDDCGSKAKAKRYYRRKTGRS
jgi:predicted RNA-binding Zn ribbon-like protein